MVQFDEKEQERRLEEFKAKEREDLARMLSEKYGVPYISLIGLGINTDALKLIPEEESRTAHAVAFDKVGRKVRIAAVSPSSEPTQEIARKLSDDGFEPELYIASDTSINKALERYKEISHTTESSEGLLSISDEEIERIIRIVHSRKKIVELVGETLTSKEQKKISHVFEIVIAGALSLRASDIHIEPEGSTIHLRFRIDGVLMPITNLNDRVYKLLLSRIKLLSGLMLNVKDTAQDGRFSISLRERDMEVRTSVLPGAYGESIVLRLLDPQTIAVPMEKLGMDANLLKVIEREISKPNGMLLNTGPTGSGKTTSLYAFLRRVNREGIKIITIEDPIEYHMEGITQTQTDPEKGYTFSKGLQSALRQDPDMLMVGEIRERETAETAIHASLTGHLVFSTLHTNNAVGTFSRLVDLGVNPKLFGPAINLTMAQRLVRKLCKTCKKEILFSSLPQQDQESLQKILVQLSEKGPYKEKGLTPSHIWEAVGCEECDGIGYQGRTGLFEAILVDGEVEKLVEKSANEQEILEAAKQQGILSMKEDGVLKVVDGVTDLRELKRVVDIYE